MLDRIVYLWFTIRGFSFASTWIEIYKYQVKTTQKSKGLKETIVVGCGVVFVYCIRVHESNNNAIDCARLWIRRCYELICCRMVPERELPLML